jgi:hypothetical protein
VFAPKLESALGNNHIGFDASGLTYPSIDGCHAVMYLTDAGMFGLHNLGGSAPADWDLRADVFKDFVSSHINGGSPGRAIYGVCFATGKTSRGYGLDNVAKTTWLAELAAFAKKLEFKGVIYGYDMSQQIHRPPVTVSYTRTGPTAVIQVKKHNQTDDTKGANTSPLNHRMIRRNTGTGKYFLQNTEVHIVTSTTNNGWKTAYPETLRS